MMSMMSPIGFPRRNLQGACQRLWYTPRMSSNQQSNLFLRIATPEDSLGCGKICYSAFSAINGAHAFPCDFPGPEAAIGVLSMMFSSPGFYCVVAEHEGRIVGSNCMDE